LLLQVFLFLFKSFESSVSILNLFVVFKVAEEVTPGDVLLQVRWIIVLAHLSKLVVLIELDLSKNLIHSEDFGSWSGHFDSIVTNKVYDGRSCTEMHEELAPVDHLLPVLVDEVEFNPHHLDL